MCVEIRKSWHEVLATTGSLFTFFTFALPIGCMHAQVGVLQPSPGMGDMCLVEWASGRQGWYDTGNDGRFELVHLETTWTSGAPVVGQYWADAKAHNPRELLWGGKELQKPAYVCAHGTASGDTAYGGTVVRVERGTHWVYGGADPDVGIIADAADGQQEGEPPPPPAEVIARAGCRYQIVARSTTNAHAT